MASLKADMSGELVSSDLKSKSSSSGDDVFVSKNALMVDDGSSLIITGCDVNPSECIEVLKSNEHAASVGTPTEQLGLHSRALQDDHSKSTTTHFDEAMSDYNVSSDECDSTPACDTYTGTIYKKLSSVFDEFKGFMFSNWQVNSAFIGHGVVSANATAIEAAGSLSITERMCCTVDNLLRGTPTMERLVAFFPTISAPRAGFNMASAFVPEHDNFVECFALFIEGSKAESTPPSSDDDNNIIRLDSMGNNLRCEIVSKLSNQVLSESGPYQCVFEEDIDSETPDDAFRGFMNKMVVKNGRLRFFQAIKSLGKYKENLSKRMVRGSSEKSSGGDQSGESSLSSVSLLTMQSPRTFLRTRLGMLSEYLTRKSDEGMGVSTSDQSVGSADNAAARLKAYFSALQTKRSEEVEDPLPTDDNARYRLEEHIKLHTGHWDEFQYDNIEIVLRDDNNSVVKLPYSCAMM